MTRVECPWCRWAGTLLECPAIVGHGAAKCPACGNAVRAAYYRQMLADQVRREREYKAYQPR